MEGNGLIASSSKKRTVSSRGEKVVLIDRTRRFRPGADSCVIFFSIIMIDRSMMMLKNTIIHTLQKLRMDVCMHSAQ